MRTLQTKPYDSSQQEEQLAGSDETTNRIVRVRSNKQLKPAEEIAQIERLKALAAMPDSEIDFSDIPAWTEEDFRNAVHGPWTEREPHTVTLHVDHEVAEWLKKSAKSHSYLINLVLKREAQREKRAQSEEHPELNKAS